MNKGQIFAERSKRQSWSTQDRENHNKRMRESIQDGDSIIVIWLDGAIAPVEPGMVGIVVSHDGYEVKCYFPNQIEGKKYRSKKRPATLMWYEVEPHDPVINPMKQHLTKMVAG